MESIDMLTLEAQLVNRLYVFEFFVLLAQLHAPYEGQEAQRTTQVYDGCRHVTLVFLVQELFLEHHWDLIGKIENFCLLFMQLKVTLGRHNLIVS